MLTSCNSNDVGESKSESVSTENAETKSEAEAEDVSDGERTIFSDEEMRLSDEEPIEKTVTVYDESLKPKETTVALFAYVPHAEFADIYNESETEVYEFTDSESPTARKTAAFLPSPLTEKK